MRRRENASGRCYEDVLRALGHELDAERFISFALIETPSGFYVKGRALTESRGESHLTTVAHNTALSAADLDALLAEARARRNDGVTRRLRWPW